MRVRVTVEENGKVENVRPACRGCKLPIKPDDDVEAVNGNVFHVWNGGGCREMSECFRSDLVDKKTGELVIRSDEPGSFVKPCLKCGGPLEMRTTRPKNGRVRVQFNCLGAACGESEGEEGTADEVERGVLSVVLGLD